MKTHSISYPLRISSEMMRVVEIRKREEHVDKATALRQLLHKGVEDYVLDLYKNGRISLSTAAELLKKNVHDVIELAEKHSIQTGANLEQHSKSLKISKKLIK